MAKAPNPKQEPKQALFAHLAVIARALGHGARLELLDFLAQGERSVEDLARVAGLSIANTSKHLQQSRGAALVQPRRDGKYVLDCWQPAAVWRRCHPEDSDTAGRFG